MRSRRLPACVDVAVKACAAAALAACLAACGSQPTIPERAALQAESIGALPAQPARSPANQEQPAVRSKVYFNLTPASLPPSPAIEAEAATAGTAGTAGTAATAAAPAAPAATGATGATGATAATTLPRRSSGDAPTGTAHGSSPAGAEEPTLGNASNAAILAELETRCTREWVSQSGGIGESSGGDQDARLSAGGRIIALSFLRETPGAADDLVLEAARAASFDEAGEDQALLAAAWLSRTGHSAEAEKIIARLCASREEGAGAKTAGEEPAGSKEADSSFEVTELTFARRIEGPGKFTRAEDSEIAAGKTLLVYGEFRNFRSVLDESAPDSKSPSYLRSFAASLRLLSTGGEEMDRLDFLPEARGRQRGAGPAEVVNFWARYTIPARLKPGAYRLVVDAKDALAGASASAELEFELEGE